MKYIIWFLLIVAIWTVFWSAVLAVSLIFGWDLVDVRHYIGIITFGILTAQLVDKIMESIYD